MDESRNDFRHSRAREVCGPDMSLRWLVSGLHPMETSAVILFWCCPWTDPAHNKDRVTPSAHPLLGRQTAERKCLGMEAAAREAGGRCRWGSTEEQRRPWAGGLPEGKSTVADVRRRAGWDLSLAQRRPPHLPLSCLPEACTAHGSWVGSVPTCGNFLQHGKVCFEENALSFIGLWGEIALNISWNLSRKHKRDLVPLLSFVLNFKTSSEHAAS